MTIWKDDPPFGPERTVQSGEWWGCAYVLIKGKPTGNIEVSDNENVANLIASAVAQSSSGAPATFGKARWSPEPNEGICEWPIDGWPDRAVDPDFVLFAEAEVGVSAWKKVEGVVVKKCDGRLLVGFSSEGDPIAIIAPRRVGEPA